MSFYQAGLAQVRCEEHERATEIDGPARAVLTAMASFCKSDPPECYAGLQSLAKRSGFKVSTVQRAQRRLAAMGLIERIDGPTRREVSVRWRLTLVASTEVATNLSSQALSVRETDNPEESIVGLSDQTPGLSDQQCPGLSDHQIKSSHLERSKRDDDDTVAPARARPDGRARSAPSTATNGELASKVAAELNLSAEDAALWIKERLAKATTKISNESAYIATCVANHHEVAAKKPRNGAAASRTATSSRRRKTARKRPAKVRLHLVPVDGGSCCVKDRAATGDVKVFNAEARERRDRWSRIKSRDVAVGLVVEMGEQGKAGSEQLYRVERVETAT